MSEVNACVVGPNWPEFYRALNRLAPLILGNLPRPLVRWFQVEGASGDWFYSDELQSALFSLWPESPERAVEQSLQHYVDAVRAQLLELMFSPSQSGWTTDVASDRAGSWEDCVHKINASNMHARVLRALICAANRPSSSD